MSQSATKYFQLVMANNGLPPTKAQVDELIQTYAEPVVEAIVADASAALISRVPERVRPMLTNLVASATPVITQVTLDLVVASVNQAIQARANAMANREGSTVLAEVQAADTAFSSGYSEGYQAGLEAALRSFAEVEVSYEETAAGEG